MHLITLGLNHDSAPIGLRERVAVTEEEVGAVLGALARHAEVREAAILSTCNRTEIYAVAADPDARWLLPWFAGERSVTAEDLSAYVYRHDAAESVRHLLRVATGLDSMVLGEPQILGQVKSAYQIARGAGTIGGVFERLFQHAFGVAKRVRTDTQIGAHPVSIAFAAVRLAQRVFTELDTATVLLIGAGDTIELAAKHLDEHKVRRLLVANRTLKHAQALASRFGGYALPLDDVERHLADADIVISATASRDPILRAQQVRQAIKTRRHRPMLLLDLAVPRDIEPEAGHLDDVYLYSVDDLDQVVEENRQSRREAAREAEAIIELQVEHFMEWWQAGSRLDVVRALRDRAQSEQAAMLEKARQMLAAGKPTEEVLAQLAHGLTNRLMHAPSAALRQAALKGDIDLLRQAQRLFALDAPIGKDTDDTGHPSQT
ncbi:MAG: glutamyl-tRNA reductase [Xanthomonadales bacterium]|nr:glutamyl-tRNA reductase [Xanthomonadales bacterium]